MNTEIELTSKKWKKGQLVSSVVAFASAMLFIVMIFVVAFFNNSGYPKPVVITFGAIAGLFFLLTLASVVSVCVYKTIAWWNHG